MPLIMVPRLSTVDEPFSFRSLISVTLSPSASSAPLESLSLMSMRVVLCDERLRLFSFPLVGRVAHRERSERCDGWGAACAKWLFAHCRALPPPRPPLRLSSGWMGNKTDRKDG